MSQFSPAPILMRVFESLRRLRFNLGVGEYIAAFDAVGAGMGSNNLEELRSVLRLLWCHSLIEQSQFDLVWEMTASVDRSLPPLPEVAASLPEMESPSVDRPVSLPEPPLPVEEVPVEEVVVEPTATELAPLPIQVHFAEAELDDLPELQTYHPVSRRSMLYTWRYLRRCLADGPADLTDMPATIEQAARQGFYLETIYRRRDTNHARLLLLVDQEGSMTPFHRFTRDLVETAQSGEVLDPEQVSVFYFYNFPTQSMYRDAHLTQPVALAQALAEADCDGDTSLLIVSDAGAARGYRRPDRIRATTRFLVQLKRLTSLISWLNPMPKERWEGSSAEAIAYLVDMQQMNDDGVRNAIDVVRGQPLSHLSGYDIARSVARSNVIRVA